MAALIAITQFQILPQEPFFQSLPLIRAWGPRKSGARAQLHMQLHHEIHNRDREWQPFTTLYAMLTTIINYYNLPGPFLWKYWAIMCSEFSSSIPLTEITRCEEITCGFKQSPTWYCSASWDQEKNKIGWKRWTKPAEFMEGKCEIWSTKKKKSGQRELGQVAEWSKLARGFGAEAGGKLLSHSDSVKHTTKCHEGKFRLLLFFIVCFKFKFRSACFHTKDGFRKD